MKNIEGSLIEKNNTVIKLQIFTFICILRASDHKIEGLTYRAPLNPKLVSKRKKFPEHIQYNLKFIQVCRKDFRFSKHFS